MTSRLPKVLLGIFVFLIILVIGVQVYIALSQPYSIETVYETTVNESFTVKGIVSREETVLDTPKSGAVSYTIRNGDKVAKNSVVAQMYPNEQDITNMAKVEQLEAELATVQESQTQGATAGTQATALNRQIDSINSEYVSALLTHDISGLYDIKNSFLSAFNRSQIVFANVQNFDTRIEQLKAEIASLQQQSGQSVSTVISPVSGYFVNTVDGFESTLTLEKAEEMTEEEINEFFSMEKPVADDSVTGKVITNAKWRYTAVVSSGDAVLLKEGKKYNLVFNSAADEIVSAEVISNSFDASEETAVVVFESDILSERLVKLRQEEAYVVLQSYEGIKIPKSALHIVDDEKGVYVKYGQGMQFKLVDIIYENEEYFISASKESELNRSDYVRIYDDVIVKGADLYDGKQLS